MSDRLPRLKENDGVTNPATGKALRGFSRFWDAAMTAIEARLKVLTDGIVVATGGGNAVTRSIVGGTGITVTNGSGILGNPTITSNFDGFGFSTSNLLADNELLGIAIFPTDISFPAAVVDDSVEALIPPAANCSLRMVPSPAGLDGSAVGTIDFIGGNRGGSVNWGSGYTLPANTPLKLFAPATRDTTMSFVAGFVPGDI